MKTKEKKHSEFINDVLSLNKRPELKKPSRTEPTLQISEFSLVKSVTGKQGGVHINDLTKVLKKRAKHVEIGKKVTSAGRKGKTLPKPLEKPKAERIRRTVAFENVKKQLNRWDAVVTSNRASNNLSFPLPDTKLESGKNFSGFRLKTDLQKDLEELAPKVEVFNLEKESEYPLTMQEMIERRKDMAKMRAVQSYKEAKARRQSKIKSKKYHRVQRREKIKQQMKEFEQLQKTDPTEALKKLEEIERVRAEERASLRHRSTGKWARNKQVQAKYDKDSRQVLAQQLSLSRDLTQKLKAKDGDSESEEETTNDTSISKSCEYNPWTNPIKTSSEVDQFLSGYRKFWENKNKTDFKPTENGNVNNEGIKMIETSDKDVEQEQIIDASNTRETLNSDDVNQMQSKEKTKTKIDKNQRNSVTKIQKINEVYSTRDNKSLYKKENQNRIEDNLKDKILENKTQPRRIRYSLKKLKQLNTSEKNKTIVKPHVGTTDWNITVLSDDGDEIDNIFDNFDQKIHKKLQVKYTKLKKDVEKQIKSKQSKKKVKKNALPLSTNKNKIDLSFSRAPTRPVIDEQLLEYHVTDETGNKNNLAVLETILKDNSIQDEKPTANNIDPNDIIKTKPVNLNTEIPDLLTLEDNEENVDQKGTISEAFEDDDIIEEFDKDKQAEIEGEKPSDINLALPGWGSWGGTGIKPSKRKSKRFIIKFPKKFKRRDDNKGHLIINEKANAKIKPHLVSEVPFPFKKVKDYEASIRAPIGNTFVPETAYRRMIKPAIRTKMGTIIEPMTDEILLRKKK